MRTIHALVLVSIPMLVACAAAPIRVAKPTPATLSASCENIDADATFVTYNATIAPGMSRQATPRVPAVAEAVRDTSYDVMCVQEAYTEHAERAVIEASGLPHDRVFTTDTAGWLETGRDRCAADAVSGIRQCVERACADVHPEETTKCAADRCMPSLVSLFLFHRSCLNCLIASAGKSLDDIVGTCVQGSGASRLYGGRNGMILLSKHPLRDLKAVRLPSSGVNRAALIATVDFPDGKSVRVACTQLSAPVASGPSHPNYDDWTDEQQAQASLVFAALKESAGTLPTVIMGDMGFSIGSAATAVLEQDTWRTFSANGYWSPAMHVEPSMCTICRGNTVTKAKEYGFLTDHVMFRVADMSRFGPVCADAVFSDEVRLQGYFGKEIVGHRSGHFGLRVRAVFPDPDPDPDSE